MAGATNIIEVNEADFESEVIQKSFETPVVVDFWAPWCGPCRMLGPILEKLAADPTYDFILAKVNADNNPILSMRYRVQGIPAVKAFRNGEIVAEFVGAQPEKRVREFIKKVAPSQGGQLLSQANSLMVIRRWHDAEALYREVLREHPGHGGAMVNLARALLAQGRGCEAKQYLESLHDGREYQQALRLLPLARYLCLAESAAEGVPDEGDVSPVEAQYQHAAYLLTRGNFAAALDGLIDVLRYDKRYRDSEAKEVVLGIFELLGDNDTLTQNYRRELASILF